MPPRRTPPIPIPHFRACDNSLFSSSSSSCCPRPSSCSPRHTPPNDPYPARAAAPRPPSPTPLYLPRHPRSFLLLLSRIRARLTLSASGEAGSADSGRAPHRPWRVRAAPVGRCGLCCSNGLAGLLCHAPSPTLHASPAVLLLFC